MGGNDDLYAEIAAERALLDEDYKRDGYLWVTEQVRTVDEATQKVRPWPIDKLYLKDIWDILESEPMIAFPKSRRMLVSWEIAVWITWKARYFPHHAIYVQSDKEEKSAFLVDKRCAFVEDNLAESWCRRPYDAIRTKAGMIGRLTYTGTKSYIVGMAQGADKVRSYTCSVLIMDECEFQDEAHAALTAALALCEDNKQVKLILISTSNGPGGVLAEMCEDVGFTRWS